MRIIVGIAKSLVAHLYLSLIAVGRDARVRNIICVIPGGQPCTPGPGNKQKSRLRAPRGNCPDRLGKQAAPRPRAGVNTRFIRASNAHAAARARAVPPPKVEKAKASGDRGKQRELSALWGEDACVCVCTRKSDRRVLPRVCLRGDCV